MLQDALRPASGIDPIAIVATVVYMLHFALPLATGFVLWLWRRPQYYDFVAGAHPAERRRLRHVPAPAGRAAVVPRRKGMLDGPDGLPLIAYLKPAAFEPLADALGFDGRYVYSFVFGSVNPNNVAAFPSLHVAYPFLTFLFLRRAFGRVGWLAFGYTALVAFSVVYTGDHWVIDAHRRGGLRLRRVLRRRARARALPGLARRAGRQPAVVVTCSVRLKPRRRSSSA